MQTALASRTRRPAIGVTIEDHTNHLSSYQAPGLTDAWSDICIANDGSILRVYLAGAAGSFSSSFQFTRITDPASASQWSTVTTFSGGSANIWHDGGCCISNNGGTIRAFAQQGTGGNAIFCWTSTTSGASWTGPVTVVSPPGSALIKGIASAGNNDVFFLYDVLGGEKMGVCAFSSSWSSITNWTLPDPVNGFGLAVSWTGSQYNIVYSDGYTLYSASYNGSIWTQNQFIAPDTSSTIGRIIPRLSFYDNLYHLCANEYDTGTVSGAVYSYCRVRESADFVHWSDGWILHDVSTSYGGNVFSLAAPQSGSSGARYYFSCPSTVLSTRHFSSSNSNQYLDVSASVLSYKRVEKINKPAELLLVIDNKGGQYNSLVNLTGSTAYQPLTPEAEIKLSEGYNVNGTPDTIATGIYRLARVDIERSPQQNQIRIVGIDLSGRLDRLARWQNAFQGQTIQWLLLEVCARAGLFNVTISAGSQLSQQIPTFVIQAGQKYRKALDSLCATYGLDYFLDQTETLQIREIQASDSSVWSYQPEAEILSFGGDFQRANHIIASGKPPGTTSYSLTTSEAYDDMHNQATRVENILHHVDQKLTTTMQTTSAASLILYAQQRAQIAHTITVPLNPALQLIDVITITDATAPVGSGQSATSRIIGHQAIYDAQKAEYESHFNLQGH
jgi:hypothetical protein